MKPTIIVVKNGVVTELSIKTVTTKAVNMFMEEYPGRSSGDLQTATIAIGILIDVLIKE